MQHLEQVTFISRMWQTVMLHCHVNIIHATVAALDAMDLQRLFHAANASRHVHLRDEDCSCTTTTHHGNNLGEERTHLSP